MVPAASQQLRLRHVRSPFFNPLRPPPSTSACVHSSPRVYLVSMLG